MMPIMTMILSYLWWIIDDDHDDDNYDDYDIEDDNDDNDDEFMLMHQVFTWANRGWWW